MCTQNQKGREHAQDEYRFPKLAHPLGVLQLSIINHIFDNLYQLIRFCQAKCFLPETFRLITDNNDVCMIVFGFDILPEFVEGPIDVLFFTGEKNPTRAGMKSAAIFLQPGRRVSLRIHTHRNQEGVLPQTIAKGLLHSFETPIYWRTDAGTGGKEGVDYYNFVL